MDLSRFALTNKVSIVTGAGRGIGKAIAIAFAMSGADVVVVARTASEIEDTATQIRDQGRKALVIQADVRNKDKVAGILKSTLDTFGRVDILVNNAGGTYPIRVLDTSLENWDEIANNNLTSVFICTKIIGETMLKQKSGNIINISSWAGMVHWPGLGPYGAAKAGIISLTKTLAVECAPYIRVNAIAPGIIMTPALSTASPETSEFRQGQLKSIPLDRFGKPEDIAWVAVFLASQASAYITGSTIVVNGGLTSTIFDYPFLKKDHSS